jgi:2'-5' RNA ligase
MRSITDYPTPNDDWEPWFADYRYGALYIFPPEPVRSGINALRQQHDPRSQAICDTHISLTVPVPRPLTATDAAELAAAARGFGPFAITFGPPYAYPGVPGVVLRIEPADPVKSLVQRLEACAAFANAPPRRYPFSPHMTIAEFITPEQTDQLLTELDVEACSGRFTCEAVSYAVPDAAFRFTERLAWPLDQGAPS